MKKFALLLSILIPLFLPLNATDIITIGDEEGEGKLLMPFQIEEGPDSNIYIYDQMDSQIKVFSPDGKYLRKIGGKGQGPGEIQRADGLSFGFTPDGNLYFTEYFAGHPWMTFMSLSGKYVDILKYDVSKFFGIGSATALKDGRYLVEFNFSGKPEKKKDYFLIHSPREIALVNNKGQILSKIKKADPITRISYHDDGADSPIPFTPHFFWSPFKKGTVLFSDGLSTKLQVYDHSGNLVEEIPTPLPKPAKVTGKHLSQWREERKEMMRSRNISWYNRFGKVIEKYKKSIHKKKPNLSELSVTPEGNILLAGSGDEETRSIDYWLMDEKGKSLAKINTSAMGIKITPHFIFFGTMDEDYIVKTYALKRQGDEASDLKQVEAYLTSSIQDVISPVDPLTDRPNIRRLDGGAAPESKARRSIPVSSAVIGHSFLGQQFHHLFHFVRRQIHSKAYTGVGTDIFAFRQKIDPVMRSDKILKGSQVGIAAFDQSLESADRLRPV